MSSATDSTELHCPLCSSPKLLVNFEKYRCFSSDVFGGLSYTKCKTCGFVYTQPFVSPSALTHFYKEVYRSEGGIQKTPVRPLDDYAIDPRGLSQFLLLDAYSNLKENPSIKILDVGPGPGYNLPCAKHVFLKSQISFYAFEPDENSIPVLEAYGVKVVPSMFDIESVRLLKKESFDIIILSHVLHHCNGCDVKDVISSLKDLLRDSKSRLLIEVPNTDLSHPAMFQKYNVPHLSFFTARSLETLARGCGLSVCFIGACGIPISVAHMLDEIDTLDEKKHSIVRDIASRILPQWSKNLLRPVSKIFWKQWEAKPRPSQPQGAFYVYRSDRCYLRAVFSKT